MYLRLWLVAAGAQKNPRPFASRGFLSKLNLPSTIADGVEKRLLALGRHTYVLDGDNVRQGLNANLSFSPEDRAENIRRVGEVSKLMVDAGLIVLVSFISPFRAERRMVREIIGADSAIPEQLC